MKYICKCNNCSADMQFEDKDVGFRAPCPACGKETKLYIPQGALPSASDRNTTSTSAPASPFTNRFTQIRGATCYRTLRMLITVTFNTLKILAGLAALLSIVATVYMHHQMAEIGQTLGARAQMTSLTLGDWMAIPLLIYLVVIIAVLHIAHHVLLMLVDIADCQIRLVSATEARTASTGQFARP